MALNLNVSKMLLIIHTLPSQNTPQNKSIKELLPPPSHRCSTFNSVHLTQTYVHASLKLSHPKPNPPTPPPRLPQKTIPDHIHIPRALHAAQREVEAPEERRGAEVEFCPGKTAVGQHTRVSVEHEIAGQKKGKEGPGGLTSCRCTCARRGQRAQRTCRGWRRMRGGRASGRG